MATEYRKIIIRKGSGTLPSDLESGELAFQTNTGKVFIGTGNGGTRELATGDVAKTVNTKTANAAGEVTIVPKDVIGGTPSNNQILRYDSTAEDWSASTLETVIGGSPSDEAILEYDSATSKWVPGVNHKVTNVSFVDGVLGVFSDGSLSGLGADIFSNTGIGDLNDVSITDASQNQFLKYDGENWVNETFSTGTFVETTLTTLTNGQTYAFSNFSSYDKIIAILYAEQGNFGFSPEQSEYPEGDTLTIYTQHQLVWDSYESYWSGTCVGYFGQPPQGGFNQQTCYQQGGNWFGDFILSFGKVTFRPGGSLDRVDSTNVEFTQPTAINGHTWKLKLVGVNF
jgi:hypothetical protein